MPDPQSPTKLTLIFDGLLVLCHNKRLNQCEIGVLSTVAGHQLQIGAEITAATGEKQILPALTLTPWLARGFGTVELDVYNPPKRGVSFRQYEGDLDRFADNKSDDFRWIVDLEGKEFHAQALNPVLDHLRPVLVVKHGEFYTAERTARNVFRSRGSEPAQDFGKIASSIAVDIPLNPDSDLLLKFANGDALNLSHLRELWVAQRLFIENICAPGTIIPLPGDSDFSLYYQAFPHIPAAERFKLSLTDPNAMLFGTPDNLCEVIGLGETETIIP